jgi:hypothetical protein
MHALHGPRWRVRIDGPSTVAQILAVERHDLDRDRRDGPQELGLAGVRAPRLRYTKSSAKSSASARVSLCAVAANVSQDSLTR